MPDELSSAAAVMDEQLVAYLDGELDAENGRRIEALLASDPEVRRRLQSLERTWDLLDELDAAPVGEPFTHTTLEMVAVAARNEVEHDRAEAPRRRRRRVLAIGGGLLAAAAAGFLAIAALAPDPNRQLLDDLPVLLQFDEYRQVDSLEFLRLLRKEQLFPGESGVRPRAARPDVDDSLAGKRRLVAELSPERKEQLRRAEERFLGLDPGQQQGLRELHADLQADPEAAALQALMNRYCDWLKTLPLYTRHELTDLPAGQRIKSVKRLREEQARESAGRLDSKDAEKLRQWMNDCVARHEAAFVKTLPKQQQEQLAQMGPAERHRRLFEQMWQSLQRRPRADAGKRPSWMADEDVARLRSQMSDEAQKRLGALPTPQAQWQQVTAWIHRALRPPGPGRGLHGPPNRPDDEQLADFFEKTLSQEERDRLLSLPGEEMQRQLRVLFMTHTRPPGGPGRPDFNRPRRPGGDWPPNEPAEKPAPPQT